MKSATYLAPTAMTHSGILPRVISFEMKQWQKFWDELDTCSAREGSDLHRYGATHATGDRSVPNTNRQREYEEFNLRLVFPLSPLSGCFAYAVTIFQQFLATQKPQNLPDCCSQPSTVFTKPFYQGNIPHVLSNSGPLVPKAFSSLRKCILMTRRDHLMDNTSHSLAQRPWSARYGLFDGFTIMNAPARRVMPPAYRFCSIFAIRRAQISSASLHHCICLIPCGDGHIVVLETFPKSSAPSFGH